MASDDILFPGRQVKVPRGVICRDVRVVVSVQPVAAGMPVVKKIIVQESRPHQLPLIDPPQMKPAGQKKADPGNRIAMAPGRHLAMLDKLFHFGSLRVFQKISEQRPELFCLVLSKFHLSSFLAGDVSLAGRSLPDISFSRQPGSLRAKGVFRAGRSLPDIPLSRAARLASRESPRNPALSSAPPGRAPSVSRTGPDESPDAEHLVILLLNRCLQRLIGDLAR